MIKKSILLFLSGLIIALILIFGWSYYIKVVRDKPIYQSLGEDLSRDLLRNIVLDVENYKQNIGFYPKSLKELPDSVEYVDPATAECKSSETFYYELNVDKETYILFSKGKDCQPFTNDDIYPNFSTNKVKEE